MNILLLLLLMFQVPVNAGMPDNMGDLEDCGLIIVYLEDEMTQEFEDYLNTLNDDVDEQAERSKREDSSSDEMRYSEHNGNIVKQAQ